MRTRYCPCVRVRVRVCVRVSVYPPIVSRQRFGRSPLIVDRQRVGKNSPIVARQRLGRDVTAVTNTQATIEELLDASFSMWPCRIKESRRLVLPRPSCFKIRKIG
jgi:hypothetical protein